MKNKQTKKGSGSKIGIVILLCLTLTMTSSVAAIGNVFTNTIQPMPFLNQLSYSFEFAEPTVSPVTIESVLYTAIAMQGCLSIGTHAGNPTLPVKTVSLLLPPRKTISSINVVGTPVPLDLPTIDLTEQLIVPSQPPIPIGYEPEKFTINTEVYSTDAVYPATIFSETTVGYSHGYAILSFNLNPIQYNPIQGTLMYYPKMTVFLTLQPAPTTNSFLKNNPQDLAYVQTLVSNPSIANMYPRAGLGGLSYPGGLCDPSNQYDYVIVTTTQNGLSSWNTTTSTPYNWNSLIAHHSGEGLVSTLVTVQDINACTAYHNTTPLFNDQQAHIREFCKDAYQDWGTRYVLIAGDADTIPARQMHYAYEGNVDSDLYWSNLDLNFNADRDSLWGEAGDSGFDLYSEIFIGRITCDTPQDVSNWLTKNLYYAEAVDGDYLENVAFYGGDTGWNCQGDDFIDYSAIKGTSNWLGPIPGSSGPFPTWAGFQFGFETWNKVHTGNQFNLSVKWTAEPPNTGWRGGSENAAITGLKNAINNNDVTLLLGIAHADNQMSLDVSATAWTSQYTNTKPFFLHDYGCHCGDFDDGDDGIIETMLFKSDVKLAFACIYNTGYGWGQFDDTNSSSAFQQKAFTDFFCDMENNSGDFSNWQLGRGHAWSKDMMAPTINWDYSYGTWRGIIECCLLFGDPAQTIKTPHPSQAPTQPSQPVGTTLAVWHKEYSFTSSSSDPESEDLYFLFDWNDGTTSGWLGPFTSGSSVTASHIWTVLGTYEVRVRARDIWGAASIWSEPLIVTVTDNTAPDVPDFTGPPEGKPGIPYRFSLLSTDAQGHDISYFIDWGDGTTSDWLGPYLSNTMIYITHSWTKTGTYTVKAKAKDSLNAESDWATLSLVMPFDVSFITNSVPRSLSLTLQRSQNIN